MARALINVPAKAKRGEIIEIKTLISHAMETGFRHTSVGARSRATSSRHVRLHLQRRGDFPRRAVSGDRRQSVHHVPHGRDRERHARVQMDRRQRLRRDRDRHDHRRMSAWRPRRFVLALALSRSRHLPQARRNPARPSAAPAMPTLAATPRRCRTTTPPIPACCAVLDGEALWKTKAGAAAQSCADCHGDAQAQHEGRRGALSGVRAALEPAGRSRAAHQPLPRRAASRRRRSPTRARSCWRSPPIVGAAVARRADRAARRRAAARRSATPGDALFNRARASSISPARNATTTTGARSSPATSIPQGHPTGYPLYRLEWQSLGSLQRRLRNCMIGMRAEPYRLRLRRNMSIWSSI